MANNRSRDKVRDGYLGDLPEPLRVKIMNIHKLIKSTVDDLIEDSNYDDLKSSRWAMSCIDEFCAMPKDKSDVGSARVFKSGPKNFRCMIQATGHFRNHQYGWIEELLHDFIGNVFTTVRPIVRKKYDMTITNEGRTGNPFEGFDIYPSPKQAAEIWNLFEDKKTKTVTESGETIPDINETIMSLQEAARGYIMESISRNTTSSPFENVSKEFAKCIKEATSINGVYDAGVIQGAYPIVKMVKFEGTTEELDYAERLYEAVANLLEAHHVDIGGTIVGVYAEDGYLGMDLVVDTSLENYVECADASQYFNEKATREEYALASFKKKYNYTPDGYITVDGRRIKVDLNYKNPYVTGEDGTKISMRCTCVVPYRWKRGDVFMDEDGDAAFKGHFIKIDEWQIALGRDFFNIGGSPDKRDAVLQHEIGHLVTQLDKSARKAMTRADRKEQRKLKNMVSRYNVSQSGHADEDEFEADRYAINRTSEKAMKTSLRRIYKYQKTPRGKRESKMTANALDTELTGLSAKEQKSIKKSIYNKYLADPKYPKKLSFELFDQYFELDPEDMSYTPILDQDKMSKLNGRTAQKIYAQALKTAYANDHQETQGDLNDRAKAMKDKALQQAKYLKKESADEIDADAMMFIESSKDGTEIDCGVKKLPKGLASIVSDMNQGVKSLMETIPEEAPYDELKEHHEEYLAALNFMIGKKSKGEIGRTIIKKESSGVCTGEIQITPMPDGPMFSQPSLQSKYNKLLSKIKSKLAPQFNKDNPGKKLVLTGPKDQRYFIIALEPSYAEKLFNYIKNPKANPLTEGVRVIYEEGTDMSETEAKKTMRTLSQSLINDFKTNKSKKMTQYTANIYANLITKNLLPSWAPSFRRFSITLEDYQSFPTVEFKVPKMTQDFVSRFIQGRESLEGFIHRQTEIKLKMSPRVFHTMKHPDDAFNFFKAAIQYYDKRIGRAGEKLMAEAMRLSPSMKHLVGTTKLSGIVTFPMTLLFVFDDVDMSNKNTFQLSQEDIRTVSSFIRNISSHYAAPEKEKKKIVDDVQSMVKTLRESCSMDENLQELYFLPDAVKGLFEGKLDKVMQEATEAWQNEQVDFMAMRQEKDPKVSYMREAFGVKKLKKIPADLVAYIQIETEAIKDANDKMMISSYCLSKIEIVEWYIELLVVGSKKYVVPHTKPWLENMRTQLLACFKKIMATPIPKGDRPIIDIKYPNGYEG